MINITEKKDCCGCTACFNICPKTCIRMEPDSEGFLYPKVDQENCINCGKCESICPVKNKTEKGGQCNAVLARTKDPELLAKCTSGGVFTEIARELVKQDGFAYGAVYGEDFKVQHERIDNLADIVKLPGSKYVQSDLGNIFLQVNEDVKAGKKVVFCGTPCQIAGLKNFIGHNKNYDNLILIDLVCHGVPSPKLWKKYLDFMERKYGKHTFINFRSKRYGYHVTVMEEEFTSGKIVYGSARTNLMLKAYFKNIADRPICYSCPFKFVNRESDITLFDGWHASDYLGDFKDDDKGYSILIIHTQKGKRIIQSMKNCLDIYPINMEQAIDLDGGMTIKSVKRPECRDVFYQYLEEYDIESTVNMLCPIKKYDYMIETIKKGLDKVGVLKFVKKLKK